MKHKKLIRSLISIECLILALLLIAIIQKPSPYCVLCYLLMALMPVFLYIAPSDANIMVLIYLFSAGMLLSYSLVGILNGSGDIYNAWYYSKLTLINGHWDPNRTTFSYNFVLPIVILMPILSMLSGMNLIYLLKIIPNLIFSLVPVILFKIYRMYLDRDIAFWSVLYIISFPAMWYMMPNVPRSEFAKFLLIITLYLILIKRNFQSLRFVLIYPLLAFSIVTSHYTTAAIYVALAISAILLVHLGCSHGTAIKNNKHFGYFTYLMIMLWVFWYGILFLSYPFIGGIQVLYRTFLILNGLFDLSGVSYAISSGSSDPSWVITMIVYGATLLIAFVGFFFLSFNHLKKESGFLPCYLVVAFIAYILPIIGYAGGIGLLRLSFTTMFVWAPIFGIGLSKSLSKITTNRRFKRLLLVSFFFVLILVNTHSLQYLFLGSSNNPAITWNVSQQKTWTTLDEYQGALFVRQNIDSVAVERGSAAGYGLIFAMKHRIKPIPRPLEGEYIYVDTQCTVYNKYVVGIWDTSGLRFVSISFTDSDVYPIYAVISNRIYSSKMWILMR
ncbi:hypothetical protein OCC_01344 [Thermococcus litoralis DSM 5473]|uniref:DUF2206 domain-containing protein n=1 Tax=Thermococcus litoralis (strain ATCC 51850 / DSM 5473 / JCM 8560 / NS-C) TaxID=523849 RepID=H3ZLJ4_THELN|nr:hypothetical protein [Thermococcus litoralis]EHR79132.1 hypothetical protein OCC_01344 [Thermococcus litoralis DSM 5473]MDK2853395.1 hypothetical protein [Thermococcaceae archaeon]